MMPSTHRSLQTACFYKIQLYFQRDKNLSLAGGRNNTRKLVREGISPCLQKKNVYWFYFSVLFYLDKKRLCHIIYDTFLKPVTITHKTAEHG